MAKGEAVWRMRGKDRTECIATESCESSGLPIPNNACH